MDRMKFPYLVLGTILIFLSSCDSAINKFCGEPVGYEKIFFDSINDKYGNAMHAQPVPCYPGYFQIDLKVDFDSLTVNYFEKMLKRSKYDEVLI